MNKFTTIEEHNKFFEKVKENPQHYDFSGKSPWEYGCCGEDNYSVIIKLYCPNCGSNNGFTNSIASSYQYDECNDCHWLGNREDLKKNEEEKINL